MSEEQKVKGGPGAVRRHARQGSWSHAECRVQSCDREFKRARRWTKRACSFASPPTVQVKVTVWLPGRSCTSQYADSKRHTPSLAAWVSDGVWSDLQGFEESVREKVAPDGVGEGRGGGGCLVVAAVGDLVRLLSPEEGEHRQNPLKTRTESPSPLTWTKLRMCLSHFQTSEDQIRPGMACTSVRQLHDLVRENSKAAG